MYIHIPHKKWHTQLVQEPPSMCTRNVRKKQDRTSGRKLRQSRAKTISRHRNTPHRNTKINHPQICDDVTLFTPTFIPGQ